MARVLPFRGVLRTPEMLKALEELEGKRVPQRTFHQWVISELVPASVRGPRGRRMEHLFNRSDLLRARLVARLRRRGLSLQRVRLVFARLGDEDLTEALVNGRGSIVVDRTKTTARLVRGGRELDLVTHPDQYLLPLRDLTEGIDATAARVEGTA